MKSTKKIQSVWPIGGAVESVSGYLFPKSDFLHSVVRLLPAYCLHLPPKACGGLIPVMGLDVTRGGKLGFEDEWTVPSTERVFGFLLLCQAIQAPIPLSAPLVFTSTVIVVPLQLLGPSKPPFQHALHSRQLQVIILKCVCLLLQAMDYQDSIFHNFLIHQIRCLFLEPRPHAFLSQGHFWMVTHYITLLFDISYAYQHIIETVNIIFTSYILLIININITKWIRKKNTTPYHQGSVRKTHHSGDLTQGFGAHTNTSFRCFNSGTWNWMQLLTGL